jgi:hypothetical protein
MTNFAKGDVVTARGTIEYIDDDAEFIGVKFDGKYDTVYMRHQCLTFVHARFEIGERIWVDDFYGFVRAINGGMAWIEREDRADYVTLPLSDLERAPLAMAEAAE